MNKKTLLSACVLVGLIVSSCDQAGPLTSSTITNSNHSSVSVDPLPASSRQFVDAVNQISFSLDCQNAINKAFELYYALDDDSWDFDEVLDAFDMLVGMDTMLQDYRLANDFVTKVEELSYHVTTDDGALIQAAFDAYSILKDSSKAFLDVSQSYEKLLIVKEKYEVLAIEEQEKENLRQIAQFVSLVRQIPSLELFVYDDINLVISLETMYEKFSTEVKENDQIIQAYEIVTAARAHYERMLEDPSIYDGILINVFLEAMKNVPAISEITLDSLPYIQEAEKQYRELTETAKLDETVLNANHLLQEARNQYNELKQNYEKEQEMQLRQEKIDEFLSLVNVLPAVELLTVDDGPALATANVAYEGLSEDIKAEESVVAAYQKLIALKEKFSQFDLEQLQVKLYSILFSTDTIPNLVFQYDGNMPFYDSIKSQYNTSSNTDLVNKVDLYLYIYFGRETDVNQYIYKVNIASTLQANSNIISGTTIKHYLEEASRNNPDVVSGAYKFGVQFVDKTGTKKDSAIYLGSATGRYTFTSQYQEPDPEAPEVIEISTTEEFLAIKDQLSGHYALTADIDLSGIEWEALGVLTGSLDGRGHKIYNLSRENGGDSDFGLFLEVASGATIRRLVLEGTIYNAGSWAGAIAVRNYGLISDCLINLNITALGNLQDDETYGNDGHVGGIVTENHSTGIISNCLVISQVVGSGTLFGNISGGLAVGNYGTIINSYANKDTTSALAAVGNDQNQLTDCFLSTNDLKNPELYENWDRSIWQIVNGSYPSLII